MDLPEQQARRTIDELLGAAGWLLQDRADFDRNAAMGVVVREFPLPAGPCDYLLFIDGKAAGVIEAKREGMTLSGVAEQSAKYMTSLPEHLARWDELLVYGYESTWSCNRHYVASANPTGGNAVTAGESEDSGLPKGWNHNSCT